MIGAEPADSLFALALLALMQYQVWVSGDAGGSHVTPAVFAAVTAFPLAWRRRWPLTVLVTVMGAALLQVWIDPHAAVPSSEVIAVLTAVYSLAVHASPRVTVIGGALGLAAMLATVERAGGGFDNYVFAGALFVASWLAGYDSRTRRSRAWTLEHRAQTLEEESEERALTAVAEERTRIARDLHDAVAHSMSVIVVQAGAERVALPAEAASTKTVLAGIEQIGRQGLAEMRRLVEMLRRDDEELALAPQPSVDHLALLAEQVREAGLPVELAIEGTRAPLPPGVDLSAYRIVQEALTNALKHAGPARARVTLRYASTQLEIEVVDDGIGGNLRAASGGHGLVGMQERVALFGGSLETRKRDGAGYHVRAVFPLGASST